MTDPASDTSASVAQPPVAKKVPHRREHHGDVVIDHYEWMRDKQNPEVIAHLEAENAYTEARTAHLESTVEAVYQEIKRRTLETDMSVPVRVDRWWYYSRTEEGKQYGISCRVPITGDDDWTPPALEPGVPVPGEEVLFDANIEAEGHEFFSLGSSDASADGRLLLYGVDYDGDERYLLRIRDLTTGEDLPGEVADTAAGAQFSPDGGYVFYQTVDDSWRPDTVWRFKVGEDPATAVQVFHEPDEAFWVSFGSTRSKQYLSIHLSSSVTSEQWMLPASDPEGEFQVVWPRKQGVEYSAEHAVVAGRDVFLVLHNDGAENFELVEVAAADPQGERTVVLPHDPAVRLEDVDAFASRLVVEYRRDGLTQVGIVPLTDAGYGRLAEVTFDEPLYTVGAASNPEWTQPTIRIGYSSFVTPSTVYDLVPAADGTVAERRLLKQQPVLGGFSPADYEQRREWAVAEDGTRIPISLVFKRGLVEPGTPAPMLLYGYGSYEASMDPAFGIPRLSLVDRGVVFAIAHVRGGGEMGRHWYEDGKKLSKKHTFSDFRDVARHLIDTGWTAPDRLVAEGRSAGGLLMGAVANLAPELFTGILAGVPFVDALTSILMPELPLTVIEWDEWGDPLHDPEVYFYMKSYSPYENVRDGVEYPAILALSGLNDTRVLYVEPTKWVARLRETGADALLKTEMAAGHGGVTGRYKAWRERAFDYAWVLDQLSLT